MCYRRFSARVENEFFHSQSNLISIFQLNATNLRTRLDSPLFLLTLRNENDNFLHQNVQKRFFSTITPNFIPPSSTISAAGAFTLTSVKLEKKVNINKSPTEEVSNGKGSREEITETAPGWELSANDRAALKDIEDSLLSLKDKSLRHYDSTFNFLPSANSRHSMIVLLGNHSAGKSTIINYLLGREVQRTGVAPTDDGFTVIQRGNEDLDEDGPTSLSDPRYQLQELQKFGLHFAHRFRMKTRRLPNSSRIPAGLMIVDSPGMIDTPIHVEDRTTLAGQLRGYDFLAATRWFAARCDVILLIFDPANPGTTGETLDVLTKSLAGFEHKFLLVMNKVDMFDKATDFARAYGALCWNLSKVLSVKDIPRIYTTFFPVKVLNGEGNVEHKKEELIDITNSKKNINTHISDEVSATIVAKQEFIRQRDEVVEELLKAPLRRLDNLITEAEEGAKRILLAGQVCTAISLKYRQNQVIAVILPSLLLCVAAILLSVAGVSNITIAIATIITTIAGGAVFGSISILRKLENDLLEDSDSFIDKIFIGKEKTMDLQLRWTNAVKPEIIYLASTSSKAGRNIISSLPVLTPWGRKSIMSILKNDIPALRLRVAEYKKRYRKEKGKEHLSKSSSLE